MPICQTDKPAKPKLSRRISGRKLDLLIIISGIMLGASTQYLSSHVWQIANMLLGMLIHGYTKQKLYDLCAYIQAVYPGMLIEMAVIIVVILVLLFWFRRDDNREIVEAIDRLGHRMRGGNATEENETNKEKNGKAKGQEGGETQDN